MIKSQMIVLHSSCLRIGTLAFGLGLVFQFIAKMSCNASSDVLFNIFNMMNSDLSYFDVYPNIKILHLNDSNEFENEISKQLEKKIEPMEPMLETLNLGNNENSRLIKICSTLNEQEKRDLKELLTEFQDVFAWSYEDMSGIDPEIAQQCINTHSHLVPVKQKLRCMRTKWLLKIKEKMTK